MITTETPVQMERVQIFDTTLRDGEQSPGISLDPLAKMDIAEELAKLGVDIIEAGFPIASQGDFEGTQAVANLFRGEESQVVICGLSRTELHDIDRCWEAIEPASNRRIHTFIATSELHMREKLRMTPEEVVKATLEGVAHARGYTDDVEFSPEDASRSDFDFMCRVLQAAVDAGATTLNIPDTVGYALPSEYAQRLADVRRRVVGDYTISAHCHDDRGLAVANSLAAVSAGARQVEVAVNGIGERAGNAALEEVVMNFVTRQDYFGVTTGINTKRLLQVSRVVSNLTGYPVQYNKAIVGRNAFAHEAGIHQGGVAANPETYEHMDPASVGQESSLPIGKHSGRAGISRRLETIGITATDMRSIVEECKRTGESVGRVLSDNELEQIAAVMTGETIQDAYHITDIVISAHNEEATANVTIQNGGEPEIISGSGNGPVDAAIKSVQQRFPGYEFGEIVVGDADKQTGSSANASVLCSVKTPNGRTLYGSAKDSNMVNATIYAFMAAINCDIRAEARK